MDTQFKAFLRFALYALRDAVSEQDAQAKQAKIEKIRDIMQAALED